jgi:hypothetical protein
MTISFKGFDDWVEIFRGGKVIDSGGNEHDGDELIDKAIETFDPKIHEPPLVLGHPNDDAPAYGWVANLKKEGSLLFAKFKQVSAGLENAIRQGHFKKRSASFYPDGKLRHVGFLGAVPPAIKGLADLKFNVGKEDVFNFEEGIMPETIVDVQTNTAPTPPNAAIMSGGGGWLEWLASIFKAGEISGASKAAPVANVMADSDPGGSAEKPLTKNDVVAIVKEVMSAAMAEPKKPAGDTDTMTMTDEEKKKKAIEEEKAALQSDYAEKEKKMKAEFSEKESAMKKERLTVFIDSLKKDGKWATAWDKLGICAFTESLSSGSEIAFAENVKASQLDWFKKFLIELPKVVNFGEIATGDKDIQTGNAAEKLEALTRKKMNEKKMADYSVAFAEVSQENPDLVTEYIPMPEV